MGASGELSRAIATTGDQFCLEHGIAEIDFLKIDVEGAEQHVLQGFEQMLSRQSIDIIQFEYGYANGDAGWLMKNFYEYLEGFGYVLGPLKSKGVIFMPFKYGLNDFRSGPNFVALNQRSVKLRHLLEGKEIRGYPTV